MSKPIEPADRRPLVYGVFVLLILVAAAYLFWPRQPKPQSLVLTPESVRTGSAAADMTRTPTDEEAAGLPADDVESVAVPEPNAISEETSISDEPPTTGSSGGTVMSSPATTTQDRQPESTAETGLADGGPAATGDWVINVGAFSSEASAKNRAEEISRQGMSAHVHRVVSEGRSLWRVRVGYFATKAKAREYADWMKTTRGIEGWASSR
jgi:cell division septation protein DedD